MTVSTRTAVGHGALAHYLGGRASDTTNHLYSISLVSLMPFSRAACSQVRHYYEQRSTAGLAERAARVFVVGCTQCDSNAVSSPRSPQRARPIPTSARPSPLVQIVAGAPSIRNGAIRSACPRASHRMPTPPSNPHLPCLRAVIATHLPSPCTQTWTYNECHDMDSSASPTRPAQ